jgi:hypothetical protein
MVGGESVTLSNAKGTMQACMAPFTSFRVTNGYWTVSFPFMPSARCGRQ